MILETFKVVLMRWTINDSIYHSCHGCTCLLLRASNASFDLKINLLIDSLDCIVFIMTDYELDEISWGILP